ncbi:MAG TPA: class I SAM-dependent methyltransferase [Acidimicrobiales bacterium]|nr:class I SAM-dependent methyltransferase [Acidimicrobiales bacterium]
MQQGTASSTAAGAAMQRVAHLVIDGEPKILIDDFAARFLDDRQRARVASHDEVLQALHVRASRAHILGRSAFTENELLRAVAEGCRQYVLLGAGYDSSPARLAHDLAGVAVFEVDHPDTQAAKRAALRPGEWPANVAFVAVDFEHDVLQARLTQAGWDAGAPTFWSWLGVAMYLTDDAVMNTLGFVSSGAAGTTIVMNFTIHDDEVTADDLALRRVGAQGVARQGEPWINFYRPHELVERVRELPYCEVASVPPDVFRTRYFDNRDDGLTWSSLTGTLVARV